MKSLERYFERGNESYNIHQSKNHFYVNESEIWYVKFGCNIGTEIDGKDYFLRPVFVLKVYGNLVICLPMTTKIKQTNFQYHLSQDSAIILDQIKSFDKKRFLKHVRSISKEHFEHIKKATKELLLG